MIFLRHFNTTPFPKIELNIISLQNNDTFVRFSSTLHIFNQTTALNHLHNLPPIPVQYSELKI